MVARNKIGGGLMRIKEVLYFVRAKCFLSACGYGQVGVGEPEGECRVVG